MHILSRLKSKYSYIFQPFFLYQPFFLFERDVKTFHTFDLRLKIQNFELKLISSLEDLSRLQNQNYDLGSECDSRSIKALIRKGGLLFCVFVEKRWAHQSWVVLNSEGFFDPFFRRSGYVGVGCIGPCTTSSDFRGLGFYPYVLNEICLYLNKVGVEQAFISTSVDNSASVKGISKAHFHPYSCGLRIKLGHKNFWLKNRLR